MTRKETSKFNLQHAYQLFQNYFSGNATDKEREIVETWNAPKEQKSKLSKSQIEKDRVLVYNKLAERFEFKESPYSAHPSFSLKTIHRQIAVAASILLIVGLGTYAIKSGSNLPFLAHEVTQAKTLFQTTDDQIRLVILSDGSRIQMNRGTQFSYTTNAFNLKLREVWLTGEAFFEVAKNPEKPFIIHTGAMQTTVRGTSFNLKAYPQLNENIVSVRSGKVEVSDATHTFGLLTHNKQLTYNTANKRTQIAESNWEDAAGWREGRLVLNGGAEELRLRLRQQFGVEVSFEKNALANERLTGTFNLNSKLTDVLTTIGAIYNIRYTIKNNHVTITSLSSN